MIHAPARPLAVCAACLTVSCARGIFRCDRAGDAGVLHKSVDELRELDREHPDFWEEQRS